MAWLLFRTHPECSNLKNTKQYKSEAKNIESGQVVWGMWKKRIWKQLGALPRFIPVNTCRKYWFVLLKKKKTALGKNNWNPPAEMSALSFTDYPDSTSEGILGIFASWEPRNGWSWWCVSNFWHYFLVFDRLWSELTWHYAANLCRHPLLCIVAVWVCGSASFTEREPCTGGSHGDKKYSGTIQWLGDVWTRVCLSIYVTKPRCQKWDLKLPVTKREEEVSLRL